MWLYLPTILLPTGSLRTITCNVTDKVSCARFLVACAYNGWIDPEGSLDLDGPAGDLLFPKAPIRKAGYRVAR